jgi:hypothetical protein
MQMSKTKAFNFVKKMFMTRFNYLFLVMICATSLVAQDYVPFPQSAEWNNVFIWQDGPTSPSIYFNEFILQDQDTIIAQYTYRKLFDQVGSQLAYVGALRETTDKRIFYYPKSDTTEHLLYQFGMQVGDTLHIHRSGIVTTVQTIDSVLVGTTYHKRYLMHSLVTMFGPEYWIEGIGSTKGLLFPHDGFEFENMNWLCSFHSNGAIYQPDAPPFETYCTTSLDPVAEKENLEIFPNPAHNFLYISEAANSTGYQIYDAVGVNCTKKVSGQGNQLDVQALKAGVYFLWSQGRCQKFLKL